MRRLALALTLALGAATLAASPALAAPFVVTSPDDEVDQAIDGVCDTAGAGVECTLRAAVQEANSTPAADTIQLPNPGGNYDLTLTGVGEDAAASGDLDVTASLTIQGSGEPVIDGLGMDRVFDVGTAGTPTLALSGLSVNGGGGVEQGAGIRVTAGSLSLNAVTVSSNLAESAAASASGGGVWLAAPTLSSITASTLNANAADGLTGGLGGGIGIAPGSALNVLNSTISGNTASSSLSAASGGGISSQGGLSLTHTTMHLNTAAGANDSGGTLALLGGTTALRASIISEGAADPGVANCFHLGGTLTTLGYNLEAPATAGTSQCGLLSGVGDRFAGDAGVTTLADRGGPTQSHALLTSSAALDAIPSCFPTTSDQRGEPRPSGPACEIGSFERQVAAPPGTGCFGEAPTIIGTAKGDTLVGTPGPDVILGQNGKDLIKGRGGKDVLCGGKDADRIYGGAAADRIAGEDGKDRLFGQAGKDTLLGNAGKDVLDGGEGRDALNGGNNRDNCRRGGKDKLRNC